VWDGEAVYERVQRIAAYVRMRREFNAKTGVRYPDDWQGDNEKNYLD